MLDSAEGTLQHRMDLNCHYFCKDAAIKPSRNPETQKASRSIPILLPAAAAQLAGPSHRAPLAPAMTVYSFYLFNRGGTCLCYREWKRPHHVHTADDDQKTMFGMLFALRNFALKLAPPGADVPGLPNHFVAGAYALHYYETPTGLRFVLTTGHDFGGVDLSTHLHNVYADIYVRYVLHNPLYVDATPIRIPVFSEKLDEYVRQLACF